MKFPCTGLCYYTRDASALHSSIFSRVRNVAKSDFWFHVCSYRTTRLPLDGFWWNLRLRLFFFRKSVSLKSDKNKGYCIWRLIFMKISRSFFVRMRSVPYKSCRENRNTHYLRSVTVFRKSCHLRVNVEKYGGARGHEWRHNMVHKSCVLDKQGYTHAHRHRQICNTYCFPRL